MKEILDKCGFLRGLGTEKLNLTGLLTPFGGEAISEQLKTQESQGVQKQGRNHRGGRPDARVADGIVIVRAGWYNTENHEKGSNHTQKDSVQHGGCRVAKTLPSDSTAFLPILLAAMSGYASVSRKTKSRTRMNG